MFGAMTGLAMGRVGGRRRCGMILVIMRTLRGWRRWKFPAEDVAATALVFGLTGFFDSSVVETEVVHRKQLIILRPRASIGGHHGLVTVEIEISHRAQDEQEYDENCELFFLLHAAVLK